MRRTRSHVYGEDASLAMRVDETLLIANIRIDSSSYSAIVNWVTQINEGEVILSANILQVLFHDCNTMIHICTNMVVDSSERQLQQLDFKSEMCTSSITQRD